MLEDFINIALTAFTEVNGDIDKFELQLRRKLMSYNVPVAQDNQSHSVTDVKNLDNLMSTLKMDNPIFNKLADVNINDMNDADIMKLVQELGLVSNTTSNE